MSEREDDSGEQSVGVEPGSRIAVDSSSGRKKPPVFDFKTDVFSGPDHRSQADIEDREKGGLGLGGTELKESDPSPAGQVKTENGEWVDPVEEVFGESRLGQVAIRTDLGCPDRVGFGSEVRNDEKFRLSAESDFPVGESNSGRKDDPVGGLG